VMPRRFYIYVALLALSIALLIAEVQRAQAQTVAPPPTCAAPVNGVCPYNPDDPPYASEPAVEAQRATGAYWPTLHAPSLVRTGGKLGFVIGAVTHHLRGKIIVEGTVYLTVNGRTVAQHELFYVNGARGKRDITRSISSGPLTLRKRSQGVRYWRIEVSYHNPRVTASCPPREPAPGCVFFQTPPTALLA